MTITPWATRRAAERRTAVDDIARALALEILRGDPAPGSHLPPLRALATRFEVTLPTVQRVIARLEAQGLVSAHQGSGVRVHDPQRQGELSLVPLWFEALASDPPRAAEVLADLLALRRVVAAHLVRRAPTRLLGALPRLAGLAAELSNAETLERRAALDLAFTRALIEASGSFAAQAVFRTIERLVEEVPWMAEAFYGDPTAHRQALAALATALATPGRSLGEAIEHALAPWDDTTVARYRHHLERS